MAAIAFAFPLLLYLGGQVQGVGLQNSMSAYYWAAIGSDYPPMRIWFVGILFIVGAFLYLYKGFTAFENYALNMAGVCSIAVAIVPMPWKCQGQCSDLTAHGVFAMLLFLCIAYVSVARATDTLDLIGNQKQRKRYRRLYRTLGFFMVASPLTAFVMTTLLTRSIATYVFFIETVGIYAFAAYWWAKSRELARTQAELLAVHGALEGTAQGLRLADSGGS